MVILGVPELEAVELLEVGLDERPAADEVDPAEAAARFAGFPFLAGFLFDVPRDWSADACLLGERRSCGAGGFGPASPSLAFQKASAASRPKATHCIAVPRIF